MPDTVVSVKQSLPQHQQDERDAGGLWEEAGAGLLSLIHLWDTCGEGGYIK